MNQEQIRKLAHQINTIEDFLNLINSIKKDMMVDSQQENSYKPFTSQFLNYYRNPNNTKNRYYQFSIKKKSGGNRIITAPCSRNYKWLLICLNEIFKALYTPSPYAMGFIKGRSILSNAICHINQNYILNIDLKDFFPSIDQARIWKRLQLKPFNFPVNISNIMAGLCSVKIEEDNKFRYVLPQGAPTSPIITNMICDTLDHRLAGLAKRFGLHYSRYADDITFSSMHNVYQKNGPFWEELNRIINQQHFSINDSKTRLLKKGYSQEVTGIIISNKLNVRRNYIKDIRNILYIWEKYGIDEAYKKFYPKYQKEKGHIKKGRPNLINVLDGKLLYLKMVKGKNDTVYKRLADKFQDLINQTNYLSEEDLDSRNTSNLIPYSEQEDLNIDSIIQAFEDLL